jgi:hypothetical protein
MLSMEGGHAMSRNSGESEGGEQGLHRAVFIVRLDRDPGGRVSGVVERVRTGEKARVDALADVGSLLAARLAREDAEPPPGS